MLGQAGCRQEPRVPMQTCGRISRSSGESQHIASADAENGRQRLLCATILAVALLSCQAPGAAIAAGMPEGVWLVEPDSALQIFDCSGLLCGKIVWLRNVRDPSGDTQRDKENPDPALRQRLLCGLTVLWALRPSGDDEWKGGWFYNPDTGKTYRATARLSSSDTMVARIYVGIPLFGETRILRRVPHLSSEGWC